MSILYFISVLLLLGAVSSRVDAASISEEPDDLYEVSLQLQWLHQFQFAGYYAALEQGYYREAGLDIEIRQGGPGIKHFDEVIEGRANYGVGSTGLLLSYLRGKPVVALAVIFQHSPDVLLAKKSSGINNPSDLIGKKVMMLEGEGNAIFRTMFSHEGIGLDQIDILPSSFNIDDLVNDKVDAFNSYTTNEPFYMQQKGIETVEINPITYGVDYYGDCLFTSQSELDENPEHVKAFRSASLKGWEYALSNKDEVIDLIIEKYSTGKSREHLRFEADAIEKIVMPKMIELGHMNPGRWKYMARTYEKLKLIEPGYLLDDFIYDPDSVRYPAWIRAAAIAIGTIFTVVSLASLILVQFNKKLRKTVARKTKELSEARNYISNIVDSMPSILVSVDVDSVVTEWNREAERSTGVPALEAIGQKLDVVLPRMIPEVDAVGEAIRSCEICTRAKQRHVIDGQIRYEDVTIYPLAGEIDKEVGGAVIRVDDVTERVKMESLMVQTEKMVSVGGLAAGMAHEINNPLSVITQGIQNILRRLDPDNEKNIEYAAQYSIDLIELNKFLQDRKIIAFLNGGCIAVERAAAIVRNMLMFSRKSDQTPNLIDLIKLVEHTIELGSVDYDMKKRFDFKFVDIIREYDDDLPMIKCCSSEIEQVLLNLFKNSLQAMEEIIREDFKPEFRVRIARDDMYVRIELEDNGPGIAEDVKKRIFEPFYTTKPVGQGTGLGLSVSYMIVTQNHSGTFEVESKLGEGACFIIRLPLT